MHHLPSHNGPGVRPRHALAVLLCLLPASSQSATVHLGFDEPAIPGEQIAFPSLTEDGFTVLPLGPVDPTPPFRIRRNGGANAGFPDAVNAYVQLLFGDSLQLVANNGLPFTPQTIDLAEYSQDFASPVTVTFTGYFAGGGNVSTIFTTDGIIDGTGPLADFESFSFPASFALIERLEVGEIVAPSDAFSLDNIVIDAIPEASTITLLAILPLLTLRRRR